VVKFWDKNNIIIPHKGTIQIAFDSEMGEDDGNGGQKTHTMLSDGREAPIDSGYFWKGVFNEYCGTVKLFKIN
jgi:hypothetical protein